MEQKENTTVEMKHEPGGDGGAQDSCSAILGTIILYALVLVGIFTNI